MKKEFQIKHCYTCSTNKNMKEFYPNKIAYDGLCSLCKACSKIKVKQWSDNNRDKRKDTQLKKLYGIDLNTFNEMSLKQDHKCLICRTFSNSKPLSVDHNHLTGQVRGLLCSPCNQAIGLLKEDLQLFENAVLYIKKFNS